MRYATRMGLAVSSLRMAWRHIAEAVTRWRLELRQRRELEVLDANALRDLGLHRSEIGSYFAESAGTAQSTRRRVTASS